MSNIFIGTSSWADPSLIESGGFYPAGIKTSAQRLQYYSGRFPLTEIDASFHYFPTGANLALWLDNTPEGFVFDIRAFSLFTGHPTPPHSLPRAVREEYPELAAHQGNLYPHHLPEKVMDRLWGIFLSFADKLKSAGKLGLILFQFPPWFHRSQENLDYLSLCRQRVGGYHAAVEFRTGDWFAGDNLELTLAFLRRQELAVVCVDEPQGLKNSVPRIAEVTAPVAMIRFHGRNKDNWEREDVDARERFNYLYSEEELAGWVAGIKNMAGQADKVHIIFKNKMLDYPVKNAGQLRALLQKG